MGFPILVRRHLYIESGPRNLKDMSHGYASLQGLVVRYLINNSEWSPSWSKSIFIVDKKNITWPIYLSGCCCWPGDARNQDISRHTIGIVCTEYFVAHIGRVIWYRGLSVHMYVVIDIFEFPHGKKSLNKRYISTTEDLNLYWVLRQNGYFLLTKFPNQFSCMKIIVFWLKLNWNLFLRLLVQISDNGLAPNPFLNQWWPSLLMHIYASLSLKGSSICI